ncbi:hypothetical protein [Paenibacillus jilunlii]|uniref:Uncharacterized protein n=1 Tax=Paenibacillus jilunlii TaxID=682956 RepID=A0A1G9QU96_9BACL|nr:hypothetical protein [Paenibacillus jilunlii]KWX74479.1 hypothetical protein AML91_14810 [Paenibacillus jilunlii]SDM14574.1 hypothetical protein SAMN05216191_109130 [Paenibacillus jilunlii]
MSLTTLSLRLRPLRLYILLNNQIAAAASPLLHLLAEAFGRDIAQNIIVGRVDDDGRQLGVFFVKGGRAEADGRVIDQELLVVFAELIGEGGMLGGGTINNPTA